MSHIIQQKMSKIKDNPIESLLILVAVLTILIISLVSCTQPPEPIRMFDMNTISNIDYQVTSSTDLVEVDGKPFELSIADANDTDSFMIFKSLIQSYESSVFETAKNKEAFTPIQTLEPSEFTIDLTTSDHNSSLRSYEIQLSLSDTKGVFIGPETSMDIDLTIVENLLNSSIINTVIDYSTLPVVELTYSNQPQTISSHGVWNHLIYSNRYMKETITLDNDTGFLQITSDVEDIPTFKFNSTLPNQLIVNIYQDSQTGKLMSSETIFPKESSIDLVLPELNGNYYIELTADWSEAPDESYGQLTYNFQANVEASETFTLSKESYQPGDLVILKGNYIDSDLNYTIESDLYNQGLSFQTSGSDYYVFLPIMSKADLGTYSINITDNDYPDQIQTIQFEIAYKEFDVQYLETSGSTASLQSNNNYDQLNEAFARGRANLTPEPLWDGVFIQPAGGRISTEYGVIRYTNGSESSSRHSGIDFANPTGTVTFASQNGYVTLAEELNITGNTLFIDHGFGIVSQYYHLNTIYVNVGDYVTAGQEVAEIGSTGFSTGPHLHFAIYNNGIYLNPWKFFDEAPF